MGNTKKPRTEWILTRWIMACVDFRATPEDAEWIRTDLNCSKDSLRQYRIGERRIRSDVENSVLDRLETRFSGTAAMLRGPMAQILMRRDLPNGALRHTIRQLPDPYRTLLLALGYGADRSEIDPGVQLGAVLDYLLQATSFETLQTVVFMLAWCDDIGDTVSWTTICERHRAALPNMIFEGIPVHHFALLDAIDEYARTIEFKHGRRIRTKRSWRTAVAKAKKIRKEGGVAVQEHWEDVPKVFAIRTKSRADENPD
ncbi:hypothetical protein [Erythrobacter sp. KY5]|uniref:hypothetical protein n=1 Tax=Erythrobacter sp. KY5 TaxID=2011159 RepID=UPI0013A6E1C4|nr:hypothetical protein [Erythrobacter sp. KY5]